MIIDAHCHIGTSNLACFFSDKRYTVDDLLRQMDRVGVDKACVSGGGFASEIKWMNEATADAVKKHPDRIIGFIRVNPWYEDFLQDLDYYLGDLGFKGIKLHPMQDSYCVLQEPRLNLILEKAHKYNVPILIHSGSEPWTMPGQIADLAAMFPDVKVIMAHSCMNNLYQHLLPCAKRVTNLILETSIGPAVGAVGSIGSSRIVYGSDWPTTSMRSEYLKVTDSGIGDLEMDDVLGGSMARILGL